MALRNEGALFAVLACAIGCSTAHGPRDPDAGADAAQPVDEACADFATALCRRRWECIPSAFEYGHGFDDAFGTEARCVERTVLACRGWQQLPGTHATSASLADCARELAELPCRTSTQILTRHAGGCDFARGALDDGEACTLGLQCASENCTASSSSPEAGSCAPAPDWWSLPDVIGAPCMWASDCGVNLVCVDGACAAPALLGESCGADRLACAVYAELDCADDGLCAPRQTSEGECGIMFDGGSSRFVACASGECVGMNDQGRGRCVPHAEDGAACEWYSGPRCLYPALCVEGRCRVPGL